MKNLNTKQAFKSNLSLFFAIVMMTFAMLLFPPPDAKAQGTTLSISADVSQFIGGANISCNTNSDGSISLTITGGDSPYTFLWSDTETDQSIYNLPAGEYTVTVTDANSTTSTAIFTLTEPDLLVASIDASSVVKVPCYGSNDGQATVTVTGGNSGYLYKWDTDPAQTNASAIGLFAGKYSVIVADTNGCLAYCSVNINEPVVDTNILISQSTIAYTDLSASQKAIYDTIAANLDSTSSIYFINIAPLGADCNNSGTYKIIMPFLYYDSILLNTGFIDFISDTSFSYFGNIVDSSPNDSLYKAIGDSFLNNKILIGDTTIIPTHDAEHYETGTLTLVSKNGVTGGGLIYGKDFYVIADLKDGVRVIFKKNIPRGSCANEDIHISNPDRTEQPQSTDGCPQNKLKILFFITPSALHYLISIGQYDYHNFARQCLTSMHGVYDNCGNLPNFDINYAFDAVVPYGLNEHSSHLDQDLTIFSSDATVQSLRASDNADLVILLTNGNYTKPNGHYTGLSVDIGPGFNIAYSIVEASAAISEYSFAHEVGHLFGARHQSCSDYTPGCDNSPLPYHGYEFEIDHWVPCLVPFVCLEKSWFRTVMAYQKSNLDPSVMIAYYSNGNSCYTAYCNTVGVGDHQLHDNASIIGNSYPIVTGYYSDGTIPFNIDFNVFGPDCIPGDGGEQVVINCGKPPYTIQWYSSFNGTYWNPISTITTSSNIAYRSINSAIHRYYKVIVTDALGNSLTSSDSYSPPANCSDIHKQSSQNKNNSQDNILDRLEVSPNPNNGTFMLNINSSIDEYAIYKIVNNLGQQLYKDKLLLKKGNNSFELKFNNLPIGYYILNLSSSTINQNKHIIIE